ncbi:MAG: aldo/keto reductase, partial [Desulfitobacteriaceae bacterium]|nr:aldo/keto reductase [Desulfitobacteriaceae bacterium]
EALWISDKYNLMRYDCLQPHYNLVHRAEFERELQAVCSKYGLGVIPYSPIAGGLLSGKYRRGYEPKEGTRSWHLRHALTERNFRIIDQLEEISRQQGKTVLQIALAWVMHQPTITSPIVGANTVEQLNEILGALEVKLSQEELAALDHISRWSDEE